LRITSLSSVYASDIAQGKSNKTGLTASTGVKVVMG